MCCAVLRCAALRWDALCCAFGFVCEFGNALGFLIFMHIGALPIVSVQEKKRPSTWHASSDDVSSTCCGNIAHTHIYNHIYTHIGCIQFPKGQTLLDLQRLAETSKLRNCYPTATPWLHSFRVLKLHTYS